MTKDNLEKILKDSIAKFYERDPFLIDQNVNERSISHKLASYIQNKTDSVEDGWDVDCEYNRVGKSELEDIYISKTLDLPIDVIYSNDVGAKTVFPDIIIHHRGKEGSENNLLVIEMKKNKKFDNHDSRKLDRYGEQLGYQFALYLNVTKEGISGFWRKSEGKVVDDAAFT